MLAASLDDLGVMSGRDSVKAETCRSLEQEVELDVPVALDAGIGRLAGKVTLDEGRDHVTFELFGVVEDVVIDAERLGHSSRVVDVSDRAAA